MQPDLPGTGPKYLESYKAALTAAGVQYDVYDIDAHGRRAPNQLGILSHYSHVVWYTGDDYVPREPDAPGGSGITKMAVDTQNEVRDFVNDGGKLFFTGKNAGRVFAEGYDYNPFQAEERTYCQNANPSCIAVQDDFLQYWLGAYRYVGGGGEDAGANPYPVDGNVRAVRPAEPRVQRRGLGQNNDHTATLLVTSSVLDPVKYPLFADSRAVAAWQRPFASPFTPHAGSWFLSAGADDISYKRLLKPFAIPAGGGSVKLWTSFDLETDYDYLFVEIHRSARTTGRRSRTPTATPTTTPGLSCITTGDGSAWQANHPFLAHYQTVVNSGNACNPTGSSGSWNAATGNSGGWQEWSLPIPAAYAGKNVEIAVSVVTDPATLGLGVWLDELRVVNSGGTPINSTDPSFETGIGGWTLPGPPGPAGPAGQSGVTGWVRAQSAPFVETPVVTTTDTVYTGFAFEAITGAANRTAFMQAVLAHLGTPTKPQFNAAPPRVDPPPAAAATPTAAARRSTAAGGAPARDDAQRARAPGGEDGPAQGRAGDARLQPALHGAPGSRRQPRDAARLQAVVPNRRNAHGHADRRERLATGSR